MKFLISGEIKLKEKRKFSKEVEAKTEKAARDKVYGLFGSNNRIKRSLISISSVKKL